MYFHSCVSAEPEQQTALICCCSQPPRHKNRLSCCPSATVELLCDTPALNGGSLSRFDHSSVGERNELHRQRQFAKSDMHNKYGTRYMNQRS